MGGQESLSNGSRCDTRVKSKVSMRGSSWWVLCSDLEGRGCVGGTEVDEAGGTAAVAGQGRRGREAGSDVAFRAWVHRLITLLLR